MSERSPYAAPSAKLADPVPRPGSPYKAVVFGLLTDFGGTIALSVLLSFIWGVMQSPDLAAGEAVEVDAWVFWLGSIGGCGFSVLGGYVCARVAGQSEYTLGAILAVLVVVIGLMLFGSGEHDLGLAVVLNATTVVAVIVGAWIGKKRNRRQRSAQ